VMKRHLDAGARGLSPDLSLLVTVPRGAQCRTVSLGLQEMTPLNKGLQTFRGEACYFSKAWGGGKKRLLITWFLVRVQVGQPISFRSFFRSFPAAIHYPTLPCGLPAAAQGVPPCESLARNSGNTLASSATSRLAASAACCASIGS